MFFLLSPGEAQYPGSFKKVMNGKYWVKTETAAKFLADHIEGASKRWFWDGRWRSKELPAPKRLADGGLRWPLHDLKAYVVRLGYATWDDF